MARSILSIGTTSLFAVSIFPFFSIKIDFCAFVQLASGLKLNVLELRRLASQLHSG